VVIEVEEVVVAVVVLVVLVDLGVVVFRRDIGDTITACLSSSSSVSSLFGGFLFPGVF
jgi:hypothetical protein